jgi:hypothetical protein
MQIAVLLMLSHFFFWPSALDWQMNQQNVVVRGAVVDGVTGRPVSGATVYAASAAFNARTTSDSKGQFFFLTLFPGTYYLTASKSDAATDVYGSSDYEPPALFAGYEYGATIVL